MLVQLHWHLNVNVGRDIRIKRSLADTKEHCSSETNTNHHGMWLHILKEEVAIEIEMIEALVNLFMVMLKKKMNRRKDRDEESNLITVAKEHVDAGRHGERIFSWCCESVLRR